MCSEPLRSAIIWIALTTPTPRSSPSRAPSRTHNRSNTMTSVATTSAYFTDDNLLMTEDDILSAMASMPVHDTQQEVGTTNAWLAQLPSNTGAFLHPERALTFDYGQQPALYAEPEQMSFQSEDLLDPQLFNLEQNCVSSNGGEALDFSRAVVYALSQQPSTW